MGTSSGRECPLRGHPLRFDVSGKSIDLANDLVSLLGMNVTIHEAKTHLSRLIQEAIHGEEVLILKGKQPMVRIVPVEAAYPERRFDGARGIIRHMSDDFNDEIDDFDEV